MTTLPRMMPGITRGSVICITLKVTVGLCYPHFLQQDLPFVHKVRAIFRSDIGNQNHLHVRQVLEKSIGIRGKYMSFDT